MSLAVSLKEQHATAAAPALGHQLLQQNERPMSGHAAAALRIGVVIPNLRLGGAEHVCTLLADELARLGHVVTVITFSPVEQDLLKVGAQVRRHALGFDDISPSRWAALRKNVGRVLALRAQLKQHDVVLSMLAEVNVCLAMAGLGSRTACVATERSNPSVLGLGRVRELLRKVTYGWLDAVVAPTTHTVNWLLNNTRTRVASVITNPLQMPLPARAPHIAPQDWLLPGRPVVLAVGRLSPEKQTDHLISAFARTRQAHPQWQLALVGEGPCLAQWQALAQSLGVGDDVVFPGRCGNMAQWYGAASIFVLSSAFEGYPNALLEALASGVPSIAYDCQTGPRELITSDVNGVLIPPSDEAALGLALQALMGEPERRERYAQHAKATADAHALAAVARQWEQVFCQALARRQKR